MNFQELLINCINCKQLINVESLVCKFCKKNTFQPKRKVFEKEKADSILTPIKRLKGLSLNVKVILQLIRIYDKISLPSSTILASALGMDQEKNVIKLEAYNYASDLFNNLVTDGVYEIANFDVINVEVNIYF